MALDLTLRRVRVSVFYKCFNKERISTRVYSKDVLLCFIFQYIVADNIMETFEATQSVYTPTIVQDEARTSIRSGSMT